MPTLDWIGKRAVLNHHREILFRLLKENPELSGGDRNSGNLLSKVSVPPVYPYLKLSGHAPSLEYP